MSPQNNRSSFYYVNCKTKEFSKTYKKHAKLANVRLEQVKYLTDVILMICVNSSTLLKIELWLYLAIEMRMEIGMGIESEIGWGIGMGTEMVIGMGIIMEIGVKIVIWIVRGMVKEDFF